jgi:LysM repeat protein
MKEENSNTYTGSAYDGSDWELYTEGEGSERGIMESGENIFTPPDYSVTDWENDEVVLSSFEVLTDYLAEEQGLGSYIIDQAATGQTTDPAEYMRDLTMRLGAPLALAKAMENAPENVKKAFRTMKTRWDKAEISGLGERLEAVGDYSADVVFSPENVLTFGSLLSGVTTGGTSAVAGLAARKTAQQAASRTLMNAVRATAAAQSKNPYKASALIGATYGGADAHIQQELNIAADIKDDYSVSETVFGTSIGAVAGMGLYAAGSKLANKYFRDGTKPAKELSVREANQYFDEALEGEFIPASGGSVVKEALRVSGPEGSIAKTVEGADDALNTAASKFAEDLGGGEKTRKEILAMIRAAADAEKTVEGQTSRIKQGLYTIASDLSGNFLGKGAGILSPITKFSGTAAQLQKKLSHEFGIKYKVQDEVVQKDLSEVQREVTGKFNERFRVIVDSLSLSEMDTKLATDINDALSKSMRSEKTINHPQFDDETNSAIAKAATEAKALYNEMGVQLNDIGVIDKLVDNYVPRMWSRSAIESNPNKLVDLFVQKAGMGKAEARRTVNNMLDVKNQVDQGTSGGYFFSAKRKIDTIGNDADFEEFLNSDVLGALHAYTYQAGKSVAKHRVLGVNNFEQFKGFYINRIRKEMTNSGENFTPKIERQLEKLYRTATGEGMERYGKTAQTAVDAYSFTNRVALLGLATLSSLTEVFINIGKAGAVNSVKGFKEALNTSHKTITKDMQSKLMTENGLTAKEALSEMRNFSIHVDQALAQVGDRLAGDELVSEGMQTASNKFFRITLLDQWTKFVQNVSFASGKNLINDNITKLASRYKNKTLDSDGEVLAGELAELGIDWKKAVDWHNSGAKTDNDFYKADFLGGAARYTNSVVLQPTAMSGIKPLLFSNPKTAVMFQLLSYPAAFSNTVLKGATKAMIKAPKRNAPKLLAAGAIMTGMARWTNYARTGGENERNKTEFEITKEAIARWGGNGLLLDSLKRAQTAAKYSKSNLAYATLPFGPAASDALSLIQQGIVPTLGNKAPLVSGSYFGKQILGDDYVTHYRRSLRKTQKDVFGEFIPEFEKSAPRPAYATGSVVRGASAAFKGLMNKASEIMEPTELSNINASKISELTEGMIDGKAIESVSRNIDSEITSAQAAGEISFADYELYELAEANVVQSMKYNQKTQEEIISNPLFSEIVEETEVLKSNEKLYDFQKSLGYDDEQILALKTIESIDKNTGQNNIIFEKVNNQVKNIKAFYDKAKIKVSPEEIEKASVNKYDEDSLDFMHDYFRNEIKKTFPLLSDKGAFELSKNAIVKVAAKGDVNFSRFKTPNISAKAEESVLLSPEARKKAQEKYIEDSENKNTVYRVVSSYENADSNISFPFAREVGTHVGTKGSADKVMIRDLALEFTGNDEKAAMSLMKQYIGTSANPKPEAYDKFFNYVSTELKKSNQTIRPYTMQEGYINVKKPLIVEEDMPSWRAEYIIQDMESISTIIKAAKSQGVKISEEDIDMIDILQIESDDYVKYIGADTKPYSTPLEKVEMDLQRAEFNMKFKDFINKLGFDSIKYRNTAEPSYAGEDPYSYILFEPEQFKLSSSKSFNTKDPRHGFVLGSVVRGATQAVKAFAPKKASGLFSEAEKAAQQLQGSKPRAGQSFLNEMKGVTSDELEWTGAKERFGNNNPATKEEVQQFFEDNDFDFEVQVGRSRPDAIEAVDDMPTLVDDELDVDDRFWAWAEENYPHDVDMLDDLVDNPEQFDAWFNSKQEEFFKKTEGDFATQPAHLDYSFEGRDTQNYRELVISIPDKYKKVDLDYQHTVHHPASKNQIAHVRLADIDQSDDAFTKTLLVDEIQSDAHQTAGGKEGVGYLTKEKANAKALKQQELEDRRQKINALELSEKEKDKLLDELLADAQNANVVFDSSNVPDLPLKKDKQWGAVGLRQAMKVAAEEGYDQVALTTGRLQAERNRKIGDINEAIFYKNPSENSTGWSVQGIRNEDEGMGDFLISFDSYEEGVERLPKIIGKENTEKLLATTPDDLGDYALKQPMTFKQGGQKYMDFYDGTLQKIWKRDFADKYGVDVKMVEYKQGDKTVQLPTLEMTEKMRADILKGLKMFAEGGYVIQKGDTLSEIARNEGMTVVEIAKLNNIQDVNKIYAGQTLTFGQDMSTDISNKAEIIKESEPVIESKQDVFEGVPEKISDITSSIAEKSDVVIDTVESTADKLSDVSKNVQSTISETFDDVKETVSGATGRTLSALKKLVGSDFSSRGRTAENTAGTTAEPKTTSVMGDMTMEQVREANTPDAPDLSDVKMPDVDFSSEGRTAENTAGTTEEPKEIKLPAIEFKPRDIEIESEKQMEDQESLVDTLKGFYNASQSQVAKNLIAFFNPLAGDKTEDDYNPQVIEALGFAASNALKKNKSTIDYGDYNLEESNVRAQVGSAAQRKRDNLEARMKSGDITPTEEAAFSVGGGGVTVEGDKVYVTDTYDFSKLERQINSVLPDEYAKLRDWISNYKGNEFKSKIFVGTLKDLGL